MAFSLIYGFTGTTNFDVLAGLFKGGSEEAGVGLLIGIVFMIAGLAFKVSAVPFHMWTPDVYEGVPTPVTAFFAARAQGCRYCIVPARVHHALWRIG